MITLLGRHLERHFSLPEHSDVIKTLIWGLGSKIFFTSISKELEKPYSCQYIKVMKRIKLKPKQQLNASLTKIILASRDLAVNCGLNALGHLTLYKV